MLKSSLRVGGLTPLTSIDYPDGLAAVVFCQGCPWRCRYCHNQHLLDSNSLAQIEWSDVILFLKKRRKFLDAVVFSGGEPTFQKALPDAIKSVKKLGFKIGLHTAGCYPEKLQSILPLLDWVGLDIKAPAEDYPKITNVPDSGDKSWKSLKLLKESDIDFEVRLTVHSQLLTETQLKTALQRLAQKKISKIALQQCHLINTSTDEIIGHPGNDWQSSPLIDYARESFPEVQLRFS